MSHNPVGVHGPRPVTGIALPVMLCSLVKVTDIFQKQQYTSTRLHGITTQKIVLFEPQNLQIVLIFMISAYFY
jgi:hypothetical protein